MATAGVIVDSLVDALFGWCGAPPVTDPGWPSARFGGRFREGATLGVIVGGPLHPSAAPPACRSLYVELCHGIRDGPRSIALSGHPAASLSGSTVSALGSTRAQPIRSPIRLHSSVKCWP